MTIFLTHRENSPAFLDDFQTTLGLIHPKDEIDGASPEISVFASGGGKKEKKKERKKKRESTQESLREFWTGLQRSEAETETRILFCAIYTVRRKKEMSRFTCAAAGTRD